MKKTKEAPKLDARAEGNPSQDREAILSAETREELAERINAEIVFYRKGFERVNRDIRAGYCLARASLLRALFMANDLKAIDEETTRLILLAEGEKSELNTDREERDYLAGDLLDEAYSQAEEKGDLNLEKIICLYVTAEILSIAIEIEDWSKTAPQIGDQKPTERPDLSGLDNDPDQTIYTMAADELQERAAHIRYFLNILGARSADQAALDALGDEPTIGQLQELRKRQGLTPEQLAALAFPKRN